MATRSLFFLIFVLLKISHGFPKNSVGTPLDAIRSLVSRVLGDEYVEMFQFEVIDSAEEGYDVFEIDSPSQGSTPILRGNNGVSLASALNYYLKYYCNCSVTWGRDHTGDQLKLPQPLILPTSRTRYIFPLKYRYYQNVCTVSYSMAWWDFARWEREIDWMAMNGINLPLSFTGQEYVWQKLYDNLGLTDEEIKGFFSGAAFLAWQRMGNMRGWGGPLDDGWINSQREIQLKIVERVRLFGMYNVLPGFSGHVPAAFKRIYPNASLIRNAAWGNFNQTFTDDYLLEPTDPLFKEIGKKFYELLIKEYGTDHFYNTDTYNEMNPSSTDLKFLAETNQVIYDTMASVDDEAVYVMQGWLFLSKFWTSDRVEAFLSNVSNENMIILDLYSEVTPLWQKFKSYFGKPFIWCMLHNFGGTRCIYGNLDSIAINPVSARTTPGSTMIGIGITPEAIEHNPVVYDLMLEMGWRKDNVDDVSNWLDLYASRRYGGYSVLTEKAWDILHSSAYRNGHQFKSLVVLGPGLKMGLSTGMNATGIVEAWLLLYQAVMEGQIDAVGPLHYDLVDIGRQCLTNLFYDMYRMFIIAYNKQVANDTTCTNCMYALTSISNEMKHLLEDLDTYLGTNTNFLFGHWIEDARNSAPADSTGEVLNNLEFNARNQVTMWGPRENIEDYASKEWSGLIMDYYSSRWGLFFEYVMKSAENSQPFDSDGYEAARGQFEREFSATIKSYPTTPAGDFMSMTEYLSSKYFSDFANYDKIDSTDISGNDLYGENAGPWTRNLKQVAYLCDINPLCVGFNSVGFLKNSTSNQVPFPNIIVYIKKEPIH